MNRPPILILTASHLCRNPRVLKEATTLAENGYPTTVLSVKNHLPSVAIDQALMESALFTYRQVDMLSPPRSILHRIQFRLARELCRRTGIGLPSSLGPVRSLLREAMRIPASLTIAHVEPALWCATRLLAQGRKVAADIEDWHSEDLLEADRRHRPTALLRRVERKLLNEAAYVTTTSHALSEALHATYGGTRAHVVYNAFPLQPNPLLPRPRGKLGERNEPSLVWFSQTVGPGRGLESFLAVWSSIHVPSQLTLIGAADEAYRKQLLTMLPQDKQRLLHFQAPVPPDDLPAELARHDLGLALETSAIRNRNLTITNKILQYLNAGLAIIATPTAGQREVLAMCPEAGFLLSNEQTSLTQAANLEQWLRSPRSITRARETARRAAEEHLCWEKVSPILLRTISHVLP